MDAKYLYVSVLTQHRFVFLKVLLSSIPLFLYDEVCLVSHQKIQAY